jgi:hypothetical protein
MAWTCVGADPGGKAGGGTGPWPVPLPETGRGNRASRAEVGVDEEEAKELVETWV